VPVSSVIIGIIAGVLCLPFGLAFLASSMPHRRAYGKGLCLGFGIQAAIGLIILLLVDAFGPPGGGF